MTFSAARTARSVRSLSSNTTRVDQRVFSRLHQSKQYQLTPCKLLKRTAMGFGEEEEDEHNLVRQPDDVGNEVLPLDIGKSNRVDEGVEECGKA